MPTGPDSRVPPPPACGSRATGAGARCVPLPLHGAMDGASPHRESTASLPSIAASARCTAAASLRMATSATAPRQPSGPPLSTHRHFHGAAALQPLSPAVPTVPRFAAGSSPCSIPHESRPREPASASPSAQHYRLRAGRHIRHRAATPGLRCFWHGPVPCQWRWVHAPACAEALPVFSL
jgi:hypothetical protein